MTNELEAGLHAEPPEMEIIIHPDPEDLVSAEAHATDEPLTTRR